MTTVNIFEQATRLGLRFPSVIGELTLEQVWGLDFTTTKPNKASLNGVAIAASDAIEAITSKNFVDESVSSNPVKLLNELRLEVVKHIISVKKAEAAAERKANADAAELKLLTDLLAEKQNDDLKGLSKDELLARIQKLRLGS